MAMSDSLACGGILAVHSRSHYTLSHGRGCQMSAGTPGLPRVYVLTTLWSDCSPCNERKMPGKCGKAGLLAQQGFKSCVRLQWQSGTVLSHWPSCLYCKCSQRITAIQGDRLASVYQSLWMCLIQTFAQAARRVTESGCYVPHKSELLNRRPGSINCTDSRARQHTCGAIFFHAYVSRSRRQRSDRMSPPSFLCPGSHPAMSHKCCPTTAACAASLTWTHQMASMR